MSARLATIGPTDDEKERILRELDDWEWSERGGRPRKKLPPYIARSVLDDLIAGMYKSAIVRKYHSYFPFSRKWLKTVYENGRLEEMAAGGAAA